jgi:hypothetical protein
MLDMVIISTRSEKFGTVHTVFEVIASDKAGTLLADAEGKRER